MKPLLYFFAMPGDKLAGDRYDLACLLPSNPMVNLAVHGIVWTHDNRLPGVK
jgi:hypothetical protein